MTKSDRKAVKWWGLPKPITVTFTPTRCKKAHLKWRPMEGAGQPGVQCRKAVFWLAIKTQKGSIMLYSAVERSWVDNKTVSIRFGDCDSIR